MMPDSEDEVSDLAVEIVVSECTTSSEEECSDGGDEFEMEEESDSESELESDYEEEEEEVKQPRAKKQQPTRRAPTTSNASKAVAGKKRPTAVKSNHQKNSLAQGGAVEGRSSILTLAKSSLPNATTTSNNINVKLPKQQYRKPILKEEMRIVLSQEDEERRKENIKALMSGRLDIHRNSLMPKLLSVQDAAAVLRKPFKSPHPNAPAQTASLKKALAARRQFVPWGAGKPFKPLKVHMTVSNEQFLDSKEDKPVSYELPPGVDPLILWESSSGDHKLQVDNALTRFLRPHQREGVQFMFECVSGLRNFEGYGCILADDMGLGKTLQGISLLWTLLNSGHDELGGKPMAKRVVICCPTSLVSNWDSECSKWLNGRVRTIPLCESSREEVISSINQFLAPACQFQLLIVSYETFRLHSERFEAENTCDLLICDEAHRLKNDQTLTNKALASMDCKRRVLLSGTPMQNQLQEFYAMVNFCNPGVLGTPSQFRKRYENPIVAGREPEATDEEKSLGQERSAELSSIVNEFILRRTNNLLSQHLPPKVVEVVCCRMTPIQFELYSHFVQSRTMRSLFSSDKSAQALSAITSVRKLLNHPKLIHDEIQASNRAGKSSGSKGFEGCERIMDPGLFDTQRGSRGSLPPGWEKMSGKFLVATRMLELLRVQTKDRVVIVSNFTQTLDLFSTYCREKKFPCLRLDGSTSNSKREKLVKQFNDANDNQFVFLLSSKAGGCGLNLIGGNRLILFDMSWNPAEDKQAAARVWRDGQRRRVYVYKFMTTGTIEEKIFQRQLSKEGLQSVVDAKEGATAGSNAMSMNELRDLFSYNPETFSTTYDHFVSNKRQKDANGEFEIDIELEGGITSDPVGMIHKQQNGNPKEEELADWGHHSSISTVPDQCMQLCGKDDVTFVFSCQVDGRPVDPDPDLMPLDAFATNRGNTHSRKPLEQIGANRPQHAIKSNNEAIVKSSKERGERLSTATENIKKQRVSSPIKDRRKQKTIVISDSDDDFM